VLIAVVLAVTAAMSNAGSNVLQRMADRDEPDERALSAQMMWSLLHRKVWLAGFAAIVSSFILQAAALHFGQLALVQPIIALELPLTLIAAAIVFGSPMGAREWSSVAMMTAGLAALVGFLDPQPGKHGSPDGVEWAVGAGLCVTVISVLVLGAC
jgi:drug/metabolite transporter (DMT)-like permease